MGALLTQASTVLRRHEAFAIRMPNLVNEVIVDFVVWSLKESLLHGQTDGFDRLGNGYLVRMSHLHRFCISEPQSEQEPFHIHPLT